MPVSVVRNFEPGGVSAASTMAFDPSTLSAPARETYIRLGRRLGAGDALMQANETLRALAAHGAELAPHGFGAADRQRLEEVRDALEGVGVDRLALAGVKMSARAAYSGAVREGLMERERGRSVLGAAALSLRDAGGSEEALRLAETTLEHTARAPEGAGRGTRLAQQLQMIVTALKDVEIAAAVVERGGPEAIVSLGEAASRLVKATRERPARRGTPEATELSDLLEGVVVALARRARRAARGAARRLGTPAVAEVFRPSFLDRRSGKGVGAGAGTDAGAGTGAEAETGAGTVAGTGAGTDAEAGTDAGAVVTVAGAEVSIGDETPGAKVPPARPAGLGCSRSLVTRACAHGAGGGRGLHLLRARGRGAAEGAGEAPRALDPPAAHRRLASWPHRPR